MIGRRVTSSARFNYLLKAQRKAPAFRTFYVDAAAGSDANPGTEAQPWATLAKVNGASLLPGDTVLLKRGQTWAGVLQPSVSGTTGRPITFGAYGTGARPIINGSAAQACLVSGKHHLRFEHLDFAGATATATVLVMDSTDLYFLDSIFRDAAVHSGFNVESTGQAITNVTVDGCLATGNYKNGYLADTPELQSVLFLNSGAEYNGHDTSAHHGFYFAFGVTVDGCWARYNSAGGFKLNDNEQAATAYRPVLKNSVSDHNNHGIIVTAAYAQVVNNLVYANADANLEVYGNAQGGAYKILGNTFVNCTNATTRAIQFSAGTVPGIEIKNNVFVQDLAVVSRSILHFDAGLGMSDFASAFDYNVYYFTSSSPTTAALLYSAADGATTKNWNEWKAAGAEAHGTLLTSVPRFVDRYADLRPAGGGNLLGLGVAVTGLEKDKNGVLRSNPPTPGCYDAPAPEKVDYVSAEVGSVAANLVRVTFDVPVAASNLTAGVTINVAGTPATISGATLEAGNQVVRYTLGANVQQGQAVTWAYDAGPGTITNEAGTYDLPSYTAQAVTNNIVDTLCEIRFEGNNLNEFSSTVNATGDLTTSAAAALNGSSYGLAVRIDDQVADYGEKTFAASATGVWRARFWIDPNTLVMGANDVFRCLELMNGANDLGGVQLNYNGGFAFRGYLKNDAGTQTDAARQYVSDAPHRVEIKLTRATNATSNDGRIDVYVDGGAATSVTGIDNYDRCAQMDRVRLGATAGLDVGTSGTFYLDELKVNNTGNEIGA